jgi:hypothetical protein
MGVPDRHLGKFEAAPLVLDGVIYHRTARHRVGA